MVYLIVSLLVGVFAGWIVGLLVRAHTAQGMLFNILIGVVGALIGGYVLSPAIGMPVAERICASRRRRLGIADRFGGVPGAVQPAVAGAAVALSAE